MVVEHPEADIIHDAVKIVRHGKAAGDLDIRAQDLQQRRSKHVIGMELAGVGKTVCGNFHGFDTSFSWVYLKSRKFSLFLQTQRDFALNSLEIHKGFLRLFALNPACACEISVIFFVFRYTLVSSGISIAQSRPWDNKKELPLGCGSSRLVLFTAPNSRSCSPARQCAARPCTGGSRGSRSWRNPADWWGRRWR